MPKRKQDTMAAPSMSLNHGGGGNVDGGVVVSNVANNGVSDGVVVVESSTTKKRKQGGNESVGASPSSSSSSVKSPNLITEQIAYCPSCIFIGNKSHLPQSVSSVSVETNFNTHTVGVNEFYEPIYHQYMVRLVASKPVDRIMFYLNSTSNIESCRIIELNTAGDLDDCYQNIFGEPLLSSHSLPYLYENIPEQQPFIQFGNVECRGNEIFIPLQFTTINPELFFVQEWIAQNPDKALEGRRKHVLGGVLDVQMSMVSSTCNSLDIPTPNMTVLCNSVVKFTFPFSVNKTIINSHLPSNLLQSDLPAIYNDIRCNGKGSMFWYPIHVPFLSRGLKLLCLLAHNSPNDKYRDLFGKLSTDGEQRYLNVGSLLLEFINGLMSEQKKKYSAVYDIKNQQVFPALDRKTVKILTHSNLHKLKIGDTAYIDNESFYDVSEGIIKTGRRCLVKVLQYGVCRKGVSTSPYDPNSTIEDEEIEIIYLVEYPTASGPKNVFVIEQELSTSAELPKQMSKEEEIEKESNEKLYNEALQEVYNINAQDLLNLEKQYQLQQLNGQSSDATDSEYHQTNHFKGDMHLHGNLVINGYVKINRQSSNVERVIINMDTKHKQFYMLYIDSIPSDVPIKVMLCLCTKFNNDRIQTQPITILETPNHFIYPKQIQGRDVCDIWFECRSIRGDEKLESTPPLPFLTEDSSTPQEVLIPLSWQHIFKRE